MASAAARDGARQLLEASGWEAPAPWVPGWKGQKSAHGLVEWGKGLAGPGKWEDEFRRAVAGQAWGSWDWEDEAAQLVARLD